MTFPLFVFGPAAKKVPSSENGMLVVVAVVAVVAVVPEMWWLSWKLSRVKPVCASPDPDLAGMRPMTTALDSFFLNEHFLPDFRGSILGMAPHTPLRGRDFTQKKGKVYVVC